MTSIGTHSGAFQADEALGVYMLRLLPQYQQATLLRSRDNEALKPLTIVIDVAGLYDHAQLRYDHHQRGFFETFDGENAASKDGGRPDVTGPESATGIFKTKLSASGLVYKHYGRDIICALHPALRGAPARPLAPLRRWVVLAMVTRSICPCPFIFYRNLPLLRQNSRP